MSLWLVSTWTSERGPGTEYALLMLHPRSPFFQESQQYPHGVSSPKLWSIGLDDLRPLGVLSRFFLNVAYTLFTADFMTCHRWVNTTVINNNKGSIPYRCQRCKFIRGLCDVHLLSTIQFEYWHSLCSTSTYIPKSSTCL